MKTDLELAQEEYLQQEAFDIVYSYVTNGEVHNSELLKHFDTSFDELVNINKQINVLPKATRSMTVYRTLVLDGKQLKKMQSSKLILGHRKYMSWTNSKKSVEKLAWQRKERGNVVIIKYNAKPNEIVLDVKKFYVKNNRTYDESFLRYVDHENEIILQHDAPFILDNTNTTLFKITDIVSPKRGDKVYDYHDEPFIIQYVEMEQPYKSHGIFLVSGEHEDDIKVRPKMTDEKQMVGSWVYIED